MNEGARSISWEGPEHYHTEKSSDWFWILGILAVAGSVASFIVGNILFGIVILLAATTMFLVGHQKPKDIPFEVSTRGVRIDETLYPFATLGSYYLDEENRVDPQLILKSQKLFVPLIIVPIPEKYIDEIEDIVSARLPEEFMEEPLSHKIMELFGF